MALTDALYRDAKPIWDAQLDHPFVKGIADGSLDEAVFQRWVIQDYAYLKEFARIFAWAVAKAQRLESMGWYAQVLNLTLNTEMELHRTYAARFDVSVEAMEQAEMWPTTRAYTDFLVRTAADGDMADLLSALLPCAWGYVHIGRALAADELPADQRYREWIEQYASDEFAEAANWLRGELDRAAEGASAEKQARIRELFLLSSRYELRFWDMCWEGESWE